MAIVMPAKVIDCRIDAHLQPKEAELYKAIEKPQATIIGFRRACGGTKNHGGRAVMAAREVVHENTSGSIFRKTLKRTRVSFAPGSLQSSRQRHERQV